MECSKTSDCFKLKKKNIIETPHLNHIKNYDWQYVYEPAEDTFLLLDALEQDLNFIQSMKPKIILEVGSGSGIIITALSKVFRSSSYCLATDINLHACKITKATSCYNSAVVEVIHTDLFSCLKENFFDMIVFNPPYVVTPSIEVTSSDLLTKSWAGGIQGREVINSFLTKYIETADKNSFGYILLLKENNPDEIIANLKKKQFCCDIIAQRKIRCEELVVLKFLKKS